MTKISFAFQGSDLSLGHQFLLGFQCVSSMPVFQPSELWHASAYSSRYLWDSGLFLFFEQFVSLPVERLHMLINPWFLGLGTSY